MLSCVYDVLREPSVKMEAAVRAYLKDTLGVEASTSPWSGAAGLPYFILDAFDPRVLTLLGRPVLLAIDKRPDRPSVASIRAHVDKIREVAGLPVLYATGTLASYERKRLIEQKVPFVVPGNQLYLPDLGVDLREYFRKPSGQPQNEFSPAAQAMLIAVLLDTPWRGQWEPAEVLVRLGYTVMTASRAAREVVAAGIASSDNVGRVRRLKTELTARQTWEHVKPLLRSPVKRRVWVHPSRDLAVQDFRVAGLSALAHQSMLAEPEWPTYALTPSQWRLASQRGVKTVPQPEPGTLQLELWSYSPALGPDGPLVDPLSLVLSLQSDADDRVQQALEELEAHVPW
jgi:hypothetical protein